MHRFWRKKSTSCGISSCSRSKLSRYVWFPTSPRLRAHCSARFSRQQSITSLNLKEKRALYRRKFCIISFGQCLFKTCAVLPFTRFQRTRHLDYPERTEEYEGEWTTIVMALHKPLTCKQACLNNDFSFYKRARNSVAGQQFTAASMEEDQKMHLFFANQDSIIDGVRLAAVPTKQNSDHTTRSCDKRSMPWITLMTPCPSSCMSVTFCTSESYIFYLRKNTW